MNKTPTFIKLLLALILVLGVVMTQQPPMATAEIAKQDGPTNMVHIDVTFDPGTKTYSLGGFSAEELRQVGAPQFPDEIWQVLVVDLHFRSREMMTLHAITLLHSPRTLTRVALNPYGCYLARNGRPESWLDKPNRDQPARIQGT